MSLDDFRSYEETAYLMKSPKNAERLNAAIADLEASKGIERDIIKEWNCHGLNKHGKITFTGRRQIRKSFIPKKPMDAPQVHSIFIRR